MEFRRSGGRDERRRRVLMDETGTTEESTAGSTPSSTTTSGSRNTPDYAEAAKAVRQVRLSDLVPRKAWLVAALTCLALLLTAGVIAAIWYAPTWPWLNQAAREIFAPGNRGSLASWFSSLLLLMCAAGAMQIYLLRRHKVNDYRGRYRLWVPVALLLFVASADAVIGLHLLLGSAVSTLLPAAWTPSTQLAWMLPFAAIVAAVGIRLAVETRRSYGTVVALTTCTVAYTMSAVVHCRPDVMSIAEISDAHALVTISLAAQLVGHVFLLLTVMLYARYVFLAANGMLAVRQPRAARKPRVKKQKPSEATADQPNEETNAKPASAGRRKKKPAAANSTAKAPAESVSPEKKTVAPSKPAAPAPKASISKQTVSTPPAEAADDSPPATISLEELAERENLSPADTAHLSKAERRRLRKLQKRSNRAA
jgi:hypothetical protein